jgi:cell division protein FtsI/penicillin-binding protein 2
MASGLAAEPHIITAEPHIIHRVTTASGEVLYEAPRAAASISSASLRLIQEGLRGVIRLPGGTAQPSTVATFRFR